MRPSWAQYSTFSLLRAGFPRGLCTTAEKGCVHLTSSHAGPGPLCCTSSAESGSRGPYCVIWMDCSLWTLSLPADTVLWLKSQSHGVFLQFLVVFCVFTSWSLFYPLIFLVYLSPCPPTENRMCSWEPCRAGQGSGPSETPAKIFRLCHELWSMLIYLQEPLVNLSGYRLIIGIKSHTLPLEKYTQDSHLRN